MRGLGGKDNIIHQLNSHQVIYCPFTLYWAAFVVFTVWTGKMKASENYFCRVNQPGLREAEISQGF